MIPVSQIGAVFDAYPDPVRVVGADGTIVAANAAARKMQPQGIGHLCKTGRTTPDPSCPACQLEGVLRHGKVRRWHVAVPREADVSDFYEVTLWPVFDGDGKLQVVIEVLRDQAATLKLEQYLIDQAERQDGELGALRDNQAEILFRDRLVALGHLVAGVAHEVNTPLSAVLSSVDLLQRSIDAVRQQLKDGSATGSKAAELSKRVDGMANVNRLIAEGSRRIEQVIRTLRIFYRVDESPLRKVDIHQGIESTLDLLAFRMGDRIRVVRDFGALPEIDCRPDAINQIIMNLVLNAAQAIPGKGEIHLRTRVEEDGVIVEVSDTGVGIDAADLPRLFELGFTTKKQGVGSGLGLAICKKIADHNGIELTAAGTPGAGAKFTVRLPLSQSAQGAP